MSKLLVFNSPAASGVQFNLENLLTAASSDSNLPSAQDRKDVSKDVTFLETKPVKITNVTPLKPSGFCDGIQSTRLLRWINHRPVLLAYIAAGAALQDTPSRLVGLVENLSVFCSSADLDVVKDWVSSSQLPVIPENEIVPPKVSLALNRRIGQIRQDLEVSLITSLVEKERESFWIVDGSIKMLSRNIQKNLVGVVKSTNSQYFPDETILYGLAPGWRSPSFTLPSPNEGNVISAYVRLHDASSSRWDLGLVRVEVASPHLLDSAAALLLSLTQSSSSQDARWDRHISPVAECESLLRNRRPIIFSV